MRFESVCQWTCRTRRGRPCGRFLGILSKYITAIHAQVRHGRIAVERERINLEPQSAGLPNWTHCRWLPVAFALVGCLLSGWMLIGIRLTNHDDIFFDLLALNPDVGLGQAGWWVATNFGRRISHLLNAPVSMLSLRVMDQGSLGDAVLLGQLAVLVGGTGLLLRRLVGDAAACGWAMCIVGGYALHWYFMPPLGYPLHGLNSLTLISISLLALQRYIDRGGKAWLALSLMLSASGSIWPEYNFVLVPLATLTMIFLGRVTWTARLRLASPYLVIWLLAVLSFVAFRWVLPPAQDEARMSLAFDPAAWLTAVGVLLGKGLLPSAMLKGIHLHTLGPPVMPSLPSELNAVVLWRLMVSAPLGFSLVFSFWTTGFFIVFRRLEVRRAGLWLLLAGGGVLMLVPVGVLALTAEYQRNLRLGYLQGALVTAHAQVGFLTLVFAAAAQLALCWRRWPLQVGLALALAALCTSAMAYNLINRDGMAANRQRWFAFALLAAAMPDGTHLHAPSLWAPTAVAVIPEGLPFGMGNYWTERARLAHGKDIAVADKEREPQPGDLRASFGVRPDGIPVLLLRRNGRAWLLAAKPRPVDPDLTGGASWRCEDYCRLDLPADPDPEVEAQLLRGPQLPRLSLLGWFTLRRLGAYGWR